MANKKRESVYEVSTPTDEERRAQLEQWAREAAEQFSLTPGQLATVLSRA